MRLNNVIEMYQNSSEQLKLADLSIDILAWCFAVPASDVSYLKSIIRISSVADFCSAMYSGTQISSKLIDNAIKCIEQSNKAQIENNITLSDAQKIEAKLQNHTSAESVKYAIKNMLRSEGRLLE